MPLFGQYSVGGVPNVAMTIPAVRGYQIGPNPIFERPYALTGITRDSTGAVVADCTVKLFRTADDSLVSQTTSDANGYYLVPASESLQHYLVAYKPGSPDVMGATINTLVGA